MIRLFIENREIELTKSVQFAITSQFENLSNPTDIINDWSKTVSIPFTAKNNSIFGHIYCPDKTIVDGGTVGVYFNPLKKLNFRLEWNGNIVMIGYAKLNEVKQKNGNGTYEVTLFGELGKIFQEMKKITFDTTSPDTDYIIDGSQYVSEYINKELVYDSWCYAEQNYNLLKKKGETGYNVNDIIGFAPNNSFSEEFKYDTFQKDANTSDTFSNVLGTGFTQDTGLEPDTVIPDGMLPREIGEYRSYNQLPFIYWNKLFQIFQEKAESLTGYEFELDNDWFNDGNPYWYNLVYMLKHFDTSKQDGSTNYYSPQTTNYYWAGSTSTEVQEKYFTISQTTEAFNLVDTFGATPTLLNVTNDYSVNLNYTLGMQLWNEGSTTAYSTRIHPNNAINLEVNLCNATGTVIQTEKFLVCDESYTGDTSSYLQSNVIKLGEMTEVGTYPNRKRILNISPTVNFFLKRYDAAQFTVKIAANWISTTYRFITKYNQGDTPVGTIPTTELVTTANSNLSAQIYYGKRSNVYFSLNDLWNKEYNIFDEIIKYCKMYRIAIKVDNFSKKISFISYPNYFSGYTIADWTNKIDKSKDFNITPITFDKKYILFNYKDTDTKLGGIYKEKYGVNYGEYKLTTEYNFNSDTTELFSNITPSITNTDNVLSWSNLYNHKVIYSFPSEIFVYNKDEDNKQVDIFGAYYFHNGLAYFSSEEALNLRSVKLSDDTNFQQNSNTYFYTQGADTTIHATSYPKLDIVRDNNLCVFNIPKENYTYLNNYSGKESIYTNLWENYLNERYNIQNKKITCYVNLKPHEYSKFEWNNFVKVGNQICIVNKIYDYDISENGTTKVDLITIQNFDGYTKNNFTFDYVIATPRELAIPYDYYKEVEIKSNHKWGIQSNDWRDTLVAYPESGTSGTTKVIIGATNSQIGGTITFEGYDDNDNVIAKTKLRVKLSGTTNMSVTPWYSEVSVGGNVQVTMSATTSWSVYQIDKHGSSDRIMVTPTSGSAGITSLTVNVPLISTVGSMFDIYIKDNNSDLITSFRVVITN